MTSDREFGLNDEEIISLSQEIDDFFAKQVLRYEMNVNAINGVFMARLLRLNQSVGHTEGLYKLLQSILILELVDCADEEFPLVGAIAEKQSLH